MKRSFKKVTRFISVLLALVVICASMPFSMAATSSPLEVKISTNKNRYTLMDEMTFTATVTNTSNRTVNNISAQALFGDSLSGIEDGSTFSVDKLYLMPGESFSFSYSAQQVSFAGLDIMFLPFVLFANMFRNNTLVNPVDNNIPEAREVTEATKKAPLLSLASSSYDSTTTVKVYYSRATEMAGIFFEEPAEENVVTDETTRVEYVNNEILISAKDGVPFVTIEQLANDIGGRIIGQIRELGEYQIRLDSIYDKVQLDNLVVRLENNSNVEGASLDYSVRLTSDHVPSDTWGGNQTWNSTLPEGRNWGVEAINAPEAWNHRDEMNPIAIGLIDCGVDENNSDITVSWAHANNYPGDHGTHVAGTMAADWDNDGVTGVMPTVNSNGQRLVTLNAVPVDKGDVDTFETMFTFEMKTAYAELILRDTKVINISLGFNWYLPDNNWGEFYFVDGDITENARALARLYSEPQEQFLKKLINMGYDFLLVCAAGNDGGIDAEFASPMNAIDDEVVRSRIITVGAIGNLGTEVTWTPFRTETHKGYYVADFSNLGDRVDIMAPGVDIYSTIPGGYDSWPGTSMAAPHVSGVAAMVWSINPLLTGAQVKQIVCSTADRPVTAEGRSYNILNAETAVEEALDSRSNIDPWQPEEPQYGLATGRVVNAADESEFLEDATVSAYTEDGDYVASATTDAHGQFELVLDPGTYTVMAYKDGYIPGVLEDITVRTGEVNYMEWFKLVSEVAPEETATVIGSIFNAIDNSVLPGVAITFTSVFSGEVVETATTNGNGQYSVELPVGYYTASLTKEGFISTTYNVAASAETEGIYQNTTMSPEGEGDTYRFVLTWGENPADLDSHIVGKRSDGTNFHVYYSNKNAYDTDGSRIVNLDVDDVTSYGPETTTLNAAPNTKYTFYVHHYAGYGTIATSGAQIKIYRGSEMIGIYNAPSGSGIYWTAFELENGVITPINTMGSSPTVSQYASSEADLFTNLPAKNY